MAPASKKPAKAPKKKALSLVKEPRFNAVTVSVTLETFDGPTRTYDIGRSKTGGVGDGKGTRDEDEIVAGIAKVSRDLVRKMLDNTRWRDGLAVMPSRPKET